MEYLDIYNDNHELLGVCEKKLAHKLGMWHDVFTCQIINPKTKTAIFQIKNHLHNNLHSKDLIEITVGGHYKSGEKIEDGIREIKEETGLDISYDKLIYLGVRQTCKTINSDYIIREFQHIHLLPLDKKISEYTGFDEDEIANMIEFDIDELIDLLLVNRKDIIGKTKDGNLNITLDNFVKSYLEGDKLYLRLLIAAKRFINSEDLKLIMW